jgi:hypothetical protein
VLWSICYVCWGRHVWTDSHEIVASGTSGDQAALIAEFSSLGASRPAGYALDDSGAARIRTGAHDRRRRHRRARLQRGGQRAADQPFDTRTGHARSA